MKRSRQARQGCGPSFGDVVFLSIVHAAEADFGVDAFEFLLRIRLAFELRPKAAALCSARHRDTDRFAQRGENIGG